MPVTGPLGSVPWRNRFPSTLWLPWDSAVEGKSSWTLLKASLSCQSACLSIFHLWLFPLLLISLPLPLYPNPIHPHPDWAKLGHAKAEPGQGEQVSSLWADRQQTGNALRSHSLWGWQIQGLTLWGSLQSAQIEHSRDGWLLVHQGPVGAAVCIYKPFKSLTLYALWSAAILRDIPELSA